MSLSLDEITTAYECILGRSPNTRELENASKRFASLSALRTAFLNSDEFDKKYERLREDLFGQDEPTLIHLHIPKTAGTSLANTLSVLPRMQPNKIVHNGTLADLRAMPRGQRRKLRYIRGHLSIGAGDAFGLPYRYLCVLREAGPRIFSFYQFINRTRTHPAFAAVNGANMTFGDYLEFSQSHPHHSVEINNGQVRRLSGESNAKSIGDEARLFRAALHTISTPSMILGVVEHLDLLLKTLVDQGYLQTEDVRQDNRSPNSDLYKAQVAALTPKQAAIFEECTAWDTSLYNIALSLVSSKIHS